MILTLNDKLKQCNSISEICETLNQNTEEILLSQIFDNIANKELFLKESKISFDISYKDGYTFEEKRNIPLITVRLVFKTQYAAPPHIVASLSMMNCLKKLSCFELGVGGSNSFGGSCDIHFLYHKNKSLFINECIETTQKNILKERNLSSNIIIASQIGVLNKISPDFLYEPKFYHLRDKYFELIEQCKNIPNTFIKRQIKHANIIIDHYKMNNDLIQKEPSHLPSKLKI